MIDTNRTGPTQAHTCHAVRAEQPRRPEHRLGALRVDLQTGTATTIVPVGTRTGSAATSSRWAPWGGWITGEENWSLSSVAVEATGRLFEVTNPTTATEGTGNPSSATT